MPADRRSSILRTSTLREPPSTAVTTQNNRSPIEAADDENADVSTSLLVREAKPSSPSLDEVDDSHNDNIHAPTYNTVQGGGTRDSSHQNVFSSVFDRFKSARPSTTTTASDLSLNPSDPNSAENKERRQRSVTSGASWNDSEISRLPSDRKRSSTFTNPIQFSSRKTSLSGYPSCSIHHGHPGTTTMQTHVVQNLSIFKQDPHRERLPHSLTVVTENLANESDGDITTLVSPNGEEIDAQKRSSINHIRALTGDLHLKKGSIPDMMFRYDTQRRRTSTFQYRTRRVALTPQGIPQREHKRAGSIATFLSSPMSNTIQQQKSPSISLDKISVPRRWISLRNVISFFNIIILVVAILVVALVSYFAGLNSTRSAIAAMSNVTMNDVILKLDGILGHAEDVNVFTETIFTSADNPITNAPKAIRNLYYLMQSFGDRLDRIYVAAKDNTFNGVSIDYLPNREVSETTFQAKYYNKTTRPYRISVRISSLCNLNDTSCVNSAFSPTATVVVNTTYDVTTRPFFQQAQALQRPGWTPVYQYANGSSLTITAIRPVWIKKAFQFVCAVDLTLNSLSNYLGSIVSILGGDRMDGSLPPTLFIVEAQTDFLIACSNLNAPVSGKSGERILAADSLDPEVRSAYSRILDKYGNLNDIQWPSNSPLILEDSTSHIFAMPYTRSVDDDIDWVVVAYIPSSSYNGKLMSAHYYEVPLAAFAVLLVAVISSVAVTRAIGKPLKELAREMLLIADLNFEYEEEEQNPEDATFALLADDDHSIDDKLKRWFWPFPRKKSGHGKKRSQNADDQGFKLKELQNLNSAMQAMKSGLKSFSKYVPIDVVTLLMKLKREAVLGVDEMELTIFFSDIVNFTAIAESITPQQLVEVMKEYLSEMSDILMQSQGVVDKYIGDAIMAFWNAPIPVYDHTTVACTSALKAQQRLRELRSMWCAKGLPEIKARIGINTGLALVGNLGSTTRLSYTCLGDNVNLASRLEVIFTDDPSSHLFRD